MPIPIVVDLDDTLARTDFFYESLLKFIKHNPLNILRAFFWLYSNDRAFLKAKIASLVDIDVTTIPLNQQLVQWLKNKKKSGHKIILATATHRKYAEAIAQHVGIFDQVLATENNLNLKGTNKEKKLVELFGEKGFTYVGDSEADLSVWRSAESAVFVGSSAQLKDNVKKVTRLDHEFPQTTNWKAVFRAIRIHQWVKNLLIFVPLLTSHNLTDLTRLGTAVIAFFAFSFCASSVYILNDFFDLEEDRKHRSKYKRVFASGEMSIIKGVMIFFMCFLVSLFLGFFVGKGFLIVLLVYFALTLLYSMYLKSQMIVDILLLAGLYTIRIIAGAVAINVQLSFWLLAFSMFLFLSLAIMKRYIELLAIKNSRLDSNVKARGYYVSYIYMLSSFGTASGCIAVLIMAFYVNSPDVIQLYSHQQVLWMVCPVLLFWIGKTWLNASRGIVDDDPISYVIKDSVSWICVLLIVVLFWLAI